MAVDAFIQFEKAMATMADVKGESMDPSFKGYFELKDFSFGVENKTTIGSATSGAGAGKIQFNEFTTRKIADAASPFFFKNCAAGAHYKLVTLAIRRPGDNATQTGKPYLVFSFGTVFCTKIDWTGPGDEGPEESITFAYGALDVAYAQQKPDGSLETPKNTSWSHEQGRVRRRCYTRALRVVVRWPHVAQVLKPRVSSRRVHWIRLAESAGTVSPRLPGITGRAGVFETSARLVGLVAVRSEGCR